MKILHTADWHIGKTLYKQPLHEEIQLFFLWMLDTIEKEQIDIIVVSGDIFDLANPSNADKETFYHVLHQIISRDIQCVITAGNHDSPSLLEGPKDLLNELNIHIIGHGSPIDRQLLTLQAKDATSAHILAVPFLRPGDITKPSGGLSYEEKVGAVRQGIVDHYQTLHKLAKAKDPSIPVIAMGHLYMQGVSLSENRSERDIHIGNLAGLTVNNLVGLFDYVALGHIHRPQKLNKEGSIRYSGSPIALSFSERKDEKAVLIIETSDQGVSDIRSLEVPVFRPLVRIEGTLAEIEESLSTYRSSGSLPALIEIMVIEKERNESIILETISLSEVASPHYRIINYKIQFETGAKALSDQSLNQDIEDLLPRDVFLKRIQQEALSDDDRSSVVEAFDEVYTALLKDQ